MRLSHLHSQPSLRCAAFRLRPRPRGCSAGTGARPLEQRSTRAFVPRRSHMHRLPAGGSQDPLPPPRERDGEGDGRGRVDEAAQEARAPPPVDVQQGRSLFCCPRCLRLPARLRGRGRRQRLADGRGGRARVGAPRRPTLRDGWITLKRENRSAVVGTRLVRRPRRAARPGAQSRQRGMRGSALPEHCLSVYALFLRIFAPCLRPDWRRKPHSLGRGRRPFSPLSSSRSGGRTSRWTSGYPAARPCASGPGPWRPRRRRRPTLRRVGTASSGRRSPSGTSSQARARGPAPAEAAAAGLAATLLIWSPLPASPARWVSAAGSFEYAVPLVRGPDGQPATRLGRTPRIPATLGLDYAVKCFTPLVVCGEDEELEGGAGGGAGGGGAGGNEGGDEGGGGGGEEGDGGGGGAGEISYRRAGGAPPGFPSG